MEHYTAQLAVCFSFLTGACILSMEYIYVSIQLLYTEQYLSMIKEQFGLVWFVLFNDTWSQ